MLSPLFDLFNGGNPESGRAESGGGDAPSAAPRSALPRSESAAWVSSARKKKLHFEVDMQLRDRMREAGKFMSMLDDEENTPCSHSAAAHLLSNGCRNLKDSTRMRIAIQFANCHLHKAGLQTYDCHEDDRVAGCVKKIGGDSVAYATYSLFYTNVEHICFYSQSQHFQEVTERAVGSLFEATVVTADHLNAFNQQNEALRDEIARETEQLRDNFSFLNARQREVLDRQRDLQEQNDELAGAVRNSTTQLHSMLNDALSVQQMAQEQLNRIRHVQSEVRSGVKRALRAHTELRALQNASAAKQSQMLANGNLIIEGQNKARALARELLEGQEAARQAVADTQAQLVTLMEAQRVAFTETADSLDNILRKTEEAEVRLTGLVDKATGYIRQLLTLDTFILNEFFQIQSLFFYVCTTILVFLLTSFHRTNRARVAVFGLVILNFLVERWVVGAAVTDQGAVVPFQNTVSAVRKFFGSLILATLIYYMVTFRDYGELNNELIQRLISVCCRVGTRDKRGFPIDYVDPTLFHPLDAREGSSLKGWSRQGSDAGNQSPGASSFELLSNDWDAGVRSSWSFRQNATKGQHPDKENNAGPTTEVKYQQKGLDKELTPQKRVTLTPKQPNRRVKAASVEPKTSSQTPVRKRSEASSKTGSRAHRRKLSAKQSGSPITPARARRTSRRIAAQKRSTRNTST